MLQPFFPQPVTPASLFEVPKSYVTQHRDTAKLIRIRAAGVRVEFAVSHAFESGLARHF
jgi:hypothetical protein